MRWAVSSLLDSASTFFQNNCDRLLVPPNNGLELTVHQAVTQQMLWGGVHGAGPKLFALTAATHAIEYTHTDRTQLKKPRVFSAVDSADPTSPDMTGTAVWREYMTL